MARAPTEHNPAIRTERGFSGDWSHDEEIKARGSDLDLLAAAPQARGSEPDILAAAAPQARGSEPDILAAATAQPAALGDSARAQATTSGTLYLVKRLEQAVRQQLEQALRQFGLTAQQYTTLTVLRARPGLSSAQLARRAFVTAQSMNEMVNALEKKGLMTRVPREDDRRVLMLMLTPRAAELLATADQLVETLEQRITAVEGLSHGELRTLLFAAIDAVTGASGS